MKINESWEELKIKIAGFMNDLETLQKASLEIDEALHRAENRGYLKGRREKHLEECDDCDAFRLLNSCNGYTYMIYQFMELSEDNRKVIRALIEQMHMAEFCKKELVNDSWDDDDE